MPSTDKNKGARADRIRRIKAGLQKYYPNVNLTLGGTSYTPAALQALLQADVDADDASTVAREKWLTAVKAARDVNSRTNPVVRAIAAQVRAQFGESQSSGDTLAEFGFTPRKVAPRTVDEKAAAAAQLRATREARGTKGTRQRKSVKGTVTATVPGTPSTEKASVEKSPAPAPATAGTGNAAPPRAT